jgi:hypothetical protein
MAYDASQVQRARDDARKWLLKNGDGYPRSWQQEKLNEERRGYVMFDDEAPPIAGYEALEQDGIAARIGVVMNDGQERVHFRLVGKDDARPAIR